VLDDSYNEPIIWMAEHDHLTERELDAIERKADEARGRVGTPAEHVRSGGMDRAHRRAVKLAEAVKRAGLLALVALALFAAPANAATLIKTNCSPVASNAAGELFFNERQPNGLFEPRVGDMNCQNGKPLLPPYNGHRGVADVAGNLILLETGTTASWSEPGRGVGMQLQLLHRGTGRVDQLTTDRKGIIWAKLHPSGTKVVWAEMVTTRGEANWWHNLLGVWSVHVADIADGRLVNERSWQHPTDPGFMEAYGWLDNDTIMFASDSGVQASTPWVGDWFAAQLWTMPDTLEGQPTRVSPPFTIKEWDWATWSLVDRSVNPYHEFMHIIDGWLYFSVVWEYDLTGVGYDSPAVYNGLDLWRMRPDGTQRERVTALHRERSANVGGLVPDRNQPGRIVAGVCNNMTCDGSIDAYEVNVGGDAADGTPYWNHTGVLD
jgi:hypothetical protein